MQIHNAAVTGSFIYNGVDLSSVTSSTSNISSLNAITASILSTTASLNLYTGSNDTNILNINSTTASLNSYTGSNNTNISNIHLTTASLNTFTGSAQSQLSALQAQTGSYATTGSNTFISNQTITGSIFGSGSLTINGCITATGQIVAQTINVQQVTSSIVYSCGSNVFGCAISNTQQLTGSVGITGSLSVNGPIVGSSTACFGGALTGTSATFSVASGNNQLSITSPSGTFPYISLIQTSNVTWALQNTATSGEFKIVEAGVADRLVIAKTTGAATFSGTVRVNGGELTVYDGASVMFTGVSTVDNYVYFGTNTANYGISFQASGDRMRLTSTGNLGLGVTPSAWTTSSGRRAIEVGALGNALFGAGSSDIRVLSNVYVNTSNQRTYANNGLAGEYQIGDGVHIWYTAPSGTANCAISFTQAMTLDACGRLGIGVSTNFNAPLTVQSDSGGRGVHLVGRSADGFAFLTFRNNANNVINGEIGISDAQNMLFYTGATVKLTISCAGAATFNSSVIVNNATTDAASALQVKVLAANATSARITSTTNNNLFSFISNGAAGHAILDMGRCTESGTFAAGFIRLRTDGDSWIQGGNVGIGTTSPLSLLDVSLLSSGARRLLINYDDSLVTIKSANASSNGENLRLIGDNIYFNTSSTGSGTERMRITSAGNVFINQTSDLSGGLTTSVQMSGVGTSSATSQASYQVHSFHGANPNWRGYYAFFKSRGTSIGSYTVVANGDDLGTIRWSGADGSGMVTGAEINAYVDGTPGVNDMPTRITFSTTADNASSPTERMRITSTGTVKIPVGNQLNLGSNSIKSTDSITVTTSTTTIFTSQTVGSVESTNLVLVNGVLSGTGSNFSDLVLFLTNGSAVVVSSTSLNSPAARTYSVSGVNLRLAMASGTYVVGVGGLIQGYNLSF